MFYDLYLFGKEVTKIRNNLGYTQKNLFELTTINIDTMRKIENGKVTPNHNTLELLSIALKVDLNQLLLNYRLNNSIDLKDIINRINVELESGEFVVLEEELTLLDDIIKQNIDNQYFSNIINQMYLLVESVIIKIRDKNYDLCLSNLIKSIKLTNPNFNLNNYDTFAYNNQEIRILMNIALAFNIIESKDKCLEVLKFCLDAMDDEIELKIRILYNLANSCYKLDLHNDTLYYSNLGINSGISKNSLSCLDLLYFRKGIAEYYLNNDNYKLSLKRAVTLFEISGKFRLKKMLISSCKKIHNIDIDSILTETYAIK